MKRRNKATASVIVVFIISLLIVSIPPARARFVIASWEYPDEYGQGIYSVYVWHNVSGSWVEFPESPFYSTDSIMLETPAGENLKLQLYCYLNRSYIGLPEPWNQGHNYIRHSVVVSTPANSSIFSQQNFTYDAFGGTADPVEWYRHTVILDFLPDYGQIYTATVTYEVFW